ncbi:MAG: hypothetical protein ACXAC7_22555, partial [Candidatus Hodarchaeales archaeon]
EDSLSEIHPQIPLNDLPAKSSFGLFGLIMDTFILLMFAYIILIRIQPGKQPLEDVTNFALTRFIFLIILGFASLYHLAGHLPIELYGRGQWGTGYESLDAWIGFDKVSHMLSSIVITMLLASLLTEYFATLGVQSKNAPVFVLIVAIAFMMMFGVLWEIFEWIMNLVLDLGHFVDEIEDAPKDLVWDLIGALIGAILSYFDLKNLPATKIISSDEYFKNLQSYQNMSHNA